MSDMLGHYDLVGRATCPAVSLVSLLFDLAALGAQRSISLSKDERRRSSATNAIESVQDVLSSVATELWLCVFCIFHGTKRCRRNCLQGPSYASHRQSRSSDLHAQAASIIQHARGGSASKRAFYLSAQVDSRRTDLPSTYERCVKLLK